MKNTMVKNQMWIGLWILGLSIIAGCGKDDNKPEQLKVEAIVS